MMLMRANKPNGKIAVALVLDSRDLHGLVDHQEIIHVSLEDVGLEGVEFDVMPGTKEDLEDAIERLGIKYQKIEKEVPDGE